MCSVTERHVQGCTTPAKGCHGGGLELFLIASDHREIALDHNGAIFHDPDMGKVFPPGYGPGGFLRSTRMPLGLKFLLSELMIVFPDQCLGGTFIDHLDDLPARSSIHIHPGPPARIEYFDQFPETGGGVNTLGGYPEHCYVSVSILSVPGIVHQLSLCSLSNKRQLIHGNVQFS